MANEGIVAIILGMFIVTYIPRLLPLITLKREMIMKVERWLKYIPPAAFSSIISINVVDLTEFDGSGIVKMLTALICLIVAIKTRKLIVTMVIGFSAYMVISFIFSVL